MSIIQNKWQITWRVKNETLSVIELKKHTHTIAYTTKTAKFRSKNKQVPNRFLSFFSQACMNRHGMAWHIHAQNIIICSQKCRILLPLFLLLFLLKWKRKRKKKKTRSRCQRYAQKKCDRKLLSYRLQPWTRCGKMCVISHCTKSWWMWVIVYDEKFIHQQNEQCEPTAVASHPLFNRTNEIDIALNTRFFSNSKDHFQ